MNELILQLLAAGPMEVRTLHALITARGHYVPMAEIKRHITLLVKLRKLQMLKLNGKVIFGLR